ncbi:MAG TPA: Crp/Fnr family transcriptional regulator [Desulfotignum sp.]|nr:Crp/Fnr family transcriptional regulator [Desulfotignum sp.]
MDILKTISLFSGLSDDQLDTLARIAIRLDFNRGEMIFQEGDNGNGIYIVETGKIKVFKLSVDGKEQILHIYGPGHTFGEVPVFQGKSFPASAMTLEPSGIIFLPRDRFVALITTTPALGMNMLADLSRRLRAFTVQIEALSLKEVPARLAAYFLTLSKEQKNKTKVRLPISKAQLSNLIGTTPETVSRMLKKMGDAGLIRVQTRTIEILDADGLNDLSESGRL